MINILIPLAGSNQFFNKAEYPFPKALIEINGKTMIEHVINNFTTIEGSKQFIFIVNNEDCKKYHLDTVLNLLTDSQCKIVRINGETKGAACSAVMAIEYINNDIPLIIANGDQILDIDLEEIIKEFSSVDGGIISFDSVHPRWSYVRLDKEDFIVETAEKRPLSKHAIAGFYFYKRGQDFIESTMKMIKKDANVDGSYYIAPTFNEMVLKNKKLIVKKIEKNDYHTFYTPKKIQEYERLK